MSKKNPEKSSVKTSVKNSSSKQETILYEEIPVLTFEYMKNKDYLTCGEICDGLGLDLSERKLINHFLYHAVRKHQAISPVPEGYEVLENEERRLCTISQTGKLVKQFKLQKGSSTPDKSGNKSKPIAEKGKLTTIKAAKASKAAKVQAEEAVSLALLKAEEAVSLLKEYRRACGGQS